MVETPYFLAVFARNSDLSVILNSPQEGLQDGPGEKAFLNFQRG